jgi:hypothetical protein
VINSDSFCNPTINLSDTVTAIDDHSDGEHPGVEQDLQSRQVYFRTHPLRRNPTHLVALAAVLVRRIARLC